MTCGSGGGVVVCWGIVRIPLPFSMKYDSLWTMSSITAQLRLEPLRWFQWRVSEQSWFGSDHTNISYTAVTIAQSQLRLSMVTDLWLTCARAKPEPSCDYRPMSLQWIPAVTRVFKLLRKCVTFLKRVSCFIFGFCTMVHFITDDAACVRDSELHWFDYSRARQQYSAC